MNTFTRILISSLILAVLMSTAACAPQAAQPSAGDIQTAIAETLAAQPTETVPVTPNPSSTPASSPTPYQSPTPTLSPPIPGSITAAFLNLRKGPSTFFDIIQTFVEGTKLTAIARTPDNEWVWVELEVEDNPSLEGWMSVLYLELDGNPAALPEAVYPDAQIIQGTIRDDQGNPLSGINVAVILQTTELDLRSDALTNAEGKWQVFIPDDLFGTLDVQIVSWTCESPIADLNSCQLSGFIQAVDRVFVAIPQQEPIEFIYEATSLRLTGSVVTSDKKAAPNFLVVAERDDGASSFGRSDANGTFSIPISPGIWEAFVIDYTPNYEEGERVSIEITDSAPDPVTLTVPK